MLYSLNKTVYAHNSRMFLSNHLRFLFLNHNDTKRSIVFFHKRASCNKDNERDKILDREIKTALHCMAYFRRRDSKCDYATLLYNTINTELFVLM